MIRHGAFLLLQISENLTWCISDQTSMLEKEAYPALDALTSKVSTLNLERVRQIKSRLVAISGGVHKVINRSSPWTTTVTFASLLASTSRVILKHSPRSWAFCQVRDELEHLLDDDTDMAAMHLSEKLAYQAAGQSARFDIGKELAELDQEGYWTILIDDRLQKSCHSIS